MKAYALITGFILSLFPFGHSLRGIETVLDVIPMAVLWFTFSVTFCVFILDDFHNHGRLQKFKDRIVTNDAYREKLLHVTIGYQVLFHILLLINYPMPEALLALAAFSYFMYRVNEV